MSKIVKIVKAQYTDVESNVVDCIIQLDDGSIHPYGAILNDANQSDTCKFIANKIKSGEIIPDPYSGPSKDELIKNHERGKRNKLLKKTDMFMSVIDYPITEAQRNEIKEYRQRLRDITTQPGFPNNINWPAIPDCIKDQLS